MKLEKFDKNKKQKRIIVGSIIGIMLLITGIIFYKSYAFFEEEKTYNILKGTIPDFDYDVKLAVTIDGKESDTIPKTPYETDENGDYYEAKVECDNEAQGEWDYNSWNLKVDYLTNTNTKCKVSFTSTINKETYEEYIKTGVATRRNTYRGKDITTLFNSGELYKQIEDGTFKDIYVGDYIRSSNNQKDQNGNDVIWLIADLDNYLYTGDSESGLTQHHATIIPAVPLQNGKMNDSDTTEGGYAESKMVTETLNTIYSTYVEPDFKFNGTNHVIEYWNLLTITVDPDAIGRDAYEGMKGASSDKKWMQRKLDLMSEINVYGSIVWSSSGFDTGIDNRQYAIFQLRPEFINSYGNSRFTYWLKDVANSKYFAFVSRNGISDRWHSNNELSIRPRFLIN